MALTMDISFLKDKLLHELNIDLTLAAEPTIKKALLQIEQQMREKLASNLIAMLDHNINFETDQQQINIRIAR